MYDIQLKTFSSLETMFAEKAAEAAAVTAIEAGEAEVEDEKDEEMTSQAKLSVSFTASASFNHKFSL